MTKVAASKERVNDQINDIKCLYHYLCRMKNSLKDKVSLMLTVSKSFFCLFV